MEKNELTKAGKNLLEGIVRNDSMEGLPKVAAYTGLAILEIAKMVVKAKKAKEQLQWRMPRFIEQKTDQSFGKGGNYVRYH